MFNFGDCRPQNITLTESYAEEVVNYTSKYNTQRSYGYAPENILGKPLRYPQYGDFPDTYMLRSYGKWWNQSKAAQSQYKDEDADVFGAEDYITLRFLCPLIPKQIFIYETYNPGAVVRIWGRYSECAWKILWEGYPQYPMAPMARKFSPPIRQLGTVINEIRLEFNQSLLTYHTSFDAVALIGYPVMHDLQIQLLREINMEPTRRTVSEEVVCCNRYDSLDVFSKLPHEIITHVFQYLDLRSLCRCAQVNRQWYNCTLDSTLYQSLSLKKYWHKINDQLLLDYFKKRCIGLRKLDISWCGDSNSISEGGFVRFLIWCGKHLTHLSLGYCEFVNVKALQTIADCEDLTDLRLKNLRCDPWRISALANLHKLTALDLYSSTIVDDALVKILRANRSLRHLVIDFCENLERLDQVAETVSLHNRQLVTWSSWKTHSLTSVGVKFIARCLCLEELDLGWCLILSDPGDCLERIAGGCKSLRRLIISGWRGVTDHMLYPVLRSCKDLAQLDLLGNKNLSAELCEAAFKCLARLELLELSFCDGIMDDQVAYWREQFPNVAIQRSCEHVTRDYYSDL